MKKFLFTLIIATCATMTKAQQTTDTVVVELAKTSRVIFTIKDRNDLEILKHYDFQQLFQDVLAKLEKSDTTSLAQRDSTASNDVAVQQSYKDGTMMTMMMTIGAIEILIITITSGAIIIVAVDGAAHRSLSTLTSERTITWKTENSPTPITLCTPYVHGDRGMCRWLPFNEHDWVQNFSLNGELA